jgi:DNA ligase D-like protein (predicted 3'-phosphoesterase)
MAFRATVHGRVQGVGFREFTRRRAIELGLSGWVRNEEDATVRVHAEGAEAQLRSLAQFLNLGPAAARVELVDLSPVPDEGHEQFAIRGVNAGIFVIELHQARALHYDFRLEMDGVLKSWAVPKEPSMDPAVKRLAIEQPDHALNHADHTSDSVEMWDRGTYEQGGRVAWPEAIERGHAVFVLHGQRLSGGFALQRTEPRPGDRNVNWLLIKRRERAD